LKYAAASHSSREVLLRVAPALKDEILDMINDEFGTAYELDSPAVGLFEDAEVLQRKVLPEIGGVGAAGGTWAALLGGGDLVSSDTDDDYEWRWDTNPHTFTGATSHHHTLLDQQESTLNLFTSLTEYWRLPYLYWDWHAGSR
jgi:hypothetical protein